MTRLASHPLIRSALQMKKNERAGPMSSVSEGVWQARCKFWAERGRATARWSTVASAQHHRRLLPRRMSVVVPVRRQSTQVGPVGPNDVDLEATKPVPQGE